MILLNSIHLSEKNESTAYPWWVIIDPHQMMSPSVDEVASMIVGPFFSREEAMRELVLAPYRYSDRARVYCHSAHRTEEYREAIDVAVGRSRKEPFDARPIDPCVVSSGGPRCNLKP
jgi:hypothetical protein